MCFTAVKNKDINKINKGSAKDAKPLKIIKPEKFKPSYALSAFAHSNIPVMRTINELEFFSWGFIQPTKTDSTETAEIKFMTANAKAETIFEKPLYKEAIFTKRCLIVLDGFYEWRHAFKKKYPHFIYHKTDPIFFIGGIWNIITESETGEKKETVSMLTTQANPMMEIIHNQKKRMPLIFDSSTAFDWINPNLTENNLIELMQPYNENKMAFHTIGRKLDPNSETTIKPVLYPELNNQQQSLF